MNARLMACAFLIGCTAATLALGEDQNIARPPSEPARSSQTGGANIARPGQNIVRVRLGKSIADEAWLSRRSKDLLDIINILYKGREAEIKELEAAQAKIEPKVQIERRIALIKATLSEKAQSAQPEPTHEP
jgi:hypothetical protein